MEQEMHLSWRVFWSLMCPGTPTQPGTCPTAGLLVLPQQPPTKGKQNLAPPSREQQRTHKACRWSLRNIQTEAAIPLYVPSHGLLAGCTLHPMGLRAAKRAGC